MLVLAFAPCTLAFAPCTSINQCKYSNCTHGGGHWMQLVLVAFFLQPLEQTLLALVVVVVVACYCCIPYWLALMLALTFAPCVLTFGLCACGASLSFNWCKFSTCTGGGCHQLQLALVVLFHSATSADSPPAHVVVSPYATGANTALALRQFALCDGQWWW